MSTASLQVQSGQRLKRAFTLSGIWGWFVTLTDFYLMATCYNILINTGRIDAYMKLETIEEWAADAWG